jgi:poly-beta-1,6-N-acetyl-D-glucosamine synthase
MMRDRSPLTARRRYLVISPVKDEERYVERTIRSMLQQTMLPTLWIIVDDGSSDGTAHILARYASEHPWIRVASRRNPQSRQPGSAVMHAFYEGLKQAGNAEFDYLVKLDCDVELRPDYFERLLEQFARDPALGIASGVYQEEDGQGWRTIDMPSYHAAGASKMLRRRCFEDIGGFVRDRGWDTIDEVRAQVSGWSTRHFADIRFKHLKPEGAGIGALRTCVLHGEVYYLTGGGPAFLLLKAGHRMLAGKPPVIGGLAILYAYLRCWWSGRQRLVNPAEAQHYRRLLNRRLVRWSPVGGLPQQQERR